MIVSNSRRCSPGRSCIYWALQLLSNHDYAKGYIRKAYTWRGIYYCTSLMFWFWDEDFWKDEKFYSAELFGERGSNKAMTLLSWSSVYWSSLVLRLLRRGTSTMLSNDRQSRWEKWFTVVKTQPAPRAAKGTLKHISGGSTGWKIATQGFRRKFEQLYGSR